MAGALRHAGNKARRHKGLVYGIHSKMAICPHHGPQGAAADGFDPQPARGRRRLDLLKFNKKRGAVMVAKVLKSAIANADIQEADVEALYVSKSFCDDGPIMKRFMPKDRGKSHSIFKRMCHITIEVDEGTPPTRKSKLAAKAAKKSAKKQAAPAAA